ncbi:MAG: hypothetical protein IT431_06840 [Phycisphaerales bacterium]|nr:hypothetical protein [Phycisphaerales bacterium]
MIWMSRIRLRVLAFTVGLAFTAIALISWAALPVIPVISVAFAAVAVGVNHMTIRLKQPVCHGCGKPLGNAPSGQYGTICRTCGSFTQVGEPRGLAQASPEEPADEDEAAV